MKKKGKIFFQTYLLFCEKKIIEDIPVAEDEYVQLMYFYRNFFKEIMGEAMGLMGRRGILAVLRTASRKYAVDKIDGYQAAQTGFQVAIKILLGLGRPEIHEEERTVVLRKCPFKTRPATGSMVLEEDVFCSICKGFINGICEYFKRPMMLLKESRIRKAKQCTFEAMQEMQSSRRYV